MLWEIRDGSCGDPDDPGAINPNLGRLEEVDMDEAFVHTTVKINDDFQLSHHAWQRMGARGVSSSAINKVLTFGRVVHTRGATIYVIGRKEIKRYMGQGENLDNLQGMQIICSNNGTIITLYRNRNLRSLKPRYRSMHHSGNQA